MEIEQERQIVEYGFGAPLMITDRSIFKSSRIKINQVICVSATPAEYELITIDNCRTIN